MKKNVIVLTIIITGMFFLTNQESNNKKINTLLKLNINAVANATILNPCETHATESCTWKEGGREHTMTKARLENPL